MRVLVVGELNADLIFSGVDSLPQLGREILADDFSLVLGSSSAICAAGLARLGTSVSFLGIAGTDVLGRFCIDELVRMGVDVSLVRADPGCKTGITASFTYEDRALVTFPGAIAQLTASDIDPAILASFNHLHVSSYYLQTGLQPGLAGLFQAARAAGLTVSLDPGGDPSDEWGPAIWSAVAHCDVLLLNEVELAGLSRLDDVHEGLRELSRGPKIVVAKLGRRGCAALADGRLYQGDAIEVKAVDTTGAGDSFNAGFLHLWLQGVPLESCLECGSICGGLSTRDLGGCAGQAGWLEVEQIMQKSGRYAIVSGTHHHDDR
jgi:sugar/nucleoside kinase (ribokinase family)